MTAASGSGERSAKLASPPLGDAMGLASGEIKLFQKHLLAEQTEERKP